MVKYAIIEVLALAWAAAVEGLSLTERDGTKPCSEPDFTRPVCQTSGGSPLASDCKKAMEQLATHCEQGNFWGDCKTQITVGTCKIDVCAPYKSKIYNGVNCKGYFQSILNECTSKEGLVGGYIWPKDCNVDYAAGGHYQLQFSRQH